MKRSWLALIILMLLAHIGQAQSFAQIENKRGDNTFTDNDFEIFIRRTQVSGKYTTPFGGTTFNFRWRIESSKE